MISIFFDLETSTTEPIGQILNYSFIATDDKFEIIDECSDSVKISPLELPVADAILANRIDVIEHQKHNYLNETLSMKKIFDFFTKMIGKNKGEKCIVESILDFEETGIGREIYLDVKFVNPNLYNSTLKTTGGTLLSYKAFKYEGTQQ